MWFTGWIVVVACILTTFSYMLFTLAGMGPSQIPLEREFGWSRAFISGGKSAAGFAGFLAPAFGYLIDRFGPRLCMLGGAFFCSGGAILCGLTDSSGLLWYVGWVMMQGIGGSVLSWPGTQKVVSTWFLKRRGLAMGTMTLAGAFAYMTATIHAALIEGYGWRASWIILGVATFFIMMAMLIFFVRNVPEEKGWRQDGIRMTPEERAAWAAARRERRPEQAARHVTTEVQFTYRQALTSPSAWLIYISTFATTCALEVQTVHQVPFAVGMGISSVVAGVILGVQGLCSAPGRFLVGWLIDRYGRGSARVWYAVGLGLQTVGYLILIYLVPPLGPTGLWIFVIVYGFGQGMGVTAPLTMLANYFGAGAFGVMVTMRVFAARMAAIVAPPFAGWVYDIQGSYVVAFWAGAVVLAVAMGLILLATPPKTPIGAAPPQART